MHGSASEYIEKVRYGLHESFGSEYLDVKCSSQNPNFELTMTGWGIFEIPLTIFLKKGFHQRQLTVNHWLNFDAPCTQKSVELTMSKNKYQQIHQK